MKLLYLWSFDVLSRSLLLVHGRETTCYLFILFVLHRKPKCQKVAFSSITITPSELFSILYLVIVDEHCGELEWVKKYQRPNVTAHYLRMKSRRFYHLARLMFKNIYPPPLRIALVLGCQHVDNKPRKWGGEAVCWRRWPT